MVSTKTAKDHPGIQCQAHVCGAFQTVPPPQGIQSLPLGKAAVALKMIKYFWI